MIWKPDTCKCELEYDGVNEPLKFVRAIKLCPEHPTEAQHVDVFSENVTKNRVHALLIANFPSLVETKPSLNADGSPVLDRNGNPVIKTDLKTGIEYRWSYDANRVLQASIAGDKGAFLVTDKAILQALVDAERGAGKVSVK